MVFPVARMSEERAMADWWSWIGVRYGGSFSSQIRNFGGRICDVGDQIYDFFAQICGFSGAVSVVVELVWDEVGCALLVSSERHWFCLWLWWE